MNIARLFKTVRAAIENYNDPHNPCGADYDRFMVEHGDTFQLCTDFDNDGYPTPEGFAKAERFVARAKNWGALRWWLYGRVQLAKMLKDIVLCETVGHKYVDDSYGGPDSGYMGGHCSRCGWSFHHVLY